ncbi:quinol:electron acceptor oxidoreductase subunit ActD [Planctomycetota bacterium]
MSSEGTGREILAVFAHLDCLLRGLRGALDRKIEIKDVYSPVPSDEVLELLKPERSPVRFATFVGGLLGLAGGLALALLTSVIWNLIVFGKPVTSVVPFLVIGFEGAILLGAIGTFAGLLLTTRLPFVGATPRAYRPEFSKDRFGVWLGCADGEVEEVRELLESAGALEVQELERRKR